MSHWCHRCRGTASAATPRVREQLLGARVEGVDGPRLRVDGRWLIDFTTSNYLGFARHPAIGAALAAAGREYGVSLAAPRLLVEDPFSAPLERALATLVGQDDALLFPSTTHAALDILPALAGEGGTILADAWAYPISREGIAVAAHGGATAIGFPHDDVHALAMILDHHRRAPARTIVCDGVYPATGRPAPLDVFARLARDHRAVLYVDDAHGVGILGTAPTTRQPFGWGGGGTPRHCGVAAAPLVHVGSLTKAFGVPLAFAAGSGSMVAHLRTTAGSRQHSSPPAIPLTAAALAAIRLHRGAGDMLRAQLVAGVRYLRRGLLHLGLIPATMGCFPVQSLHLPSARETLMVARRLYRAGIRVVPQVTPADAPAGGALRVVVTVQHGRDELDRLLEGLAWAMPRRAAGARTTTMRPR